MSEAEEIVIEEEVESEDKTKEAFSTEEFKVKGEELVETVKKLVKEAGVRRIVVKNKHGKVLIEVPMVLGIAGIFILPTYSALALIAAIVAECTIEVERAKKSPEPEIEPEESAS